MKKSTIIALTGTVFAVGLILSLLLLLTEMPNQQKNGFNRHWLTAVVTPLRETNIKMPLDKICGITAGNIFFTVPNPQVLIMADQELNIRDTILFPLTITEKLFGANDRVVDSPWVYFFANNVPAVFYGQMHSNTINTVHLTNSLFTRSLYISPTCIILRALDSDQKEQVFQKVDSRTGLVLKEATIIKDQKDKGFSSDGLLRYDSHTQCLIYIQYFQNRFYCLDTNLNLLYAAKTIDTTNTNHMLIKSVELKDENRLMPTGPRIMVNEECSASNGYLFIASGLKADNEQSKFFKQNTVVDIYKISNGTYAGSFYIPRPGREKIKSLVVRNNLLVVLYKDYIRTYKVNAFYANG